MRKIYVLFSLCTVLFSVNGFSQEMFLKLATIQGESNSERHRNEIDVYSYSQGMTTCPQNNSANSGANACKVNISSLALMLKFDKSNIALKNALLLGTHLASADFVQDRTSNDGRSAAFYKVHMEDVTIVSQQESNAAGSGQAPTLAIELNFSKIAWEYTSQNSDGRPGERVSVGWDLAANRPWTYTFPN